MKITMISLIIVKMCIRDRYYSEAKYEDNSMGIGLPLAKAVIEKQGGYISVESDDEETVFIVKYIK